MSGENSSQDVLARQMQECAELYRRRQISVVPNQDEFRRALSGLNEMNEAVGRLIEQWKAEHLAKAQAHDKSNPPGQDYENYSTPIIAVAEAIRLVGFSELAHRLYEKVVALTDQHCQPPGRDLHRGALYANYGITLLERGDFELGLSWLLAAANEDVRFNRIQNVRESYALSEPGIFGQWVESKVLPCVHSDVFGFVGTRLGASLGFADLMQMLRALAGNGDLNLLRGLVEYESVRGRTDYLGDSVRFNCLRDLATLFEVFLKRVGDQHVDANVRAAFSKPPMAAKIIHFMHYTTKPTNPAWSHKEGLFWNSVLKQTDELEAIRAGFSYVSDFVANPIASVRTYLNSTMLLDATRAEQEDVGKRMLLAYRLRNETSHSFKPQDPGIVAHADEFQLWLLQAIFYVYFWFTRTGQVTL